MKHHILVTTPGTKDCVAHRVRVSVAGMPDDPAERPAHLRPDMTGRFTYVKRGTTPNPIPARIAAIRACLNEVRG